MSRVSITLLAVFSALPVVPPSASGGGFERAIAAVMPRVVKLYGLGAGLQAGYGTGVIVSQDGLVLTVFSLLIDARRIRAVTSDGTIHQASLVHHDPRRQLALLRLTPATGDRNSDGGTFPYFDLSRDAALAPGGWVLAAGNPFKVAVGPESMSVVHGVFSARTRLDARRRLKDFPYRGDILVIDAVTSNPGAPGSALVNLDGEFVGMIGRQVVSNLTHTHFNYAVPRDVLYGYFLEACAADAGSVAQQHMRQARDAGKPSEPVDLGIRLSRLGYKKVLPFVERVRLKSPAHSAGVRADDLILSVNGRNVADVSAYENRVKYLLPDEPVDLVIRRGRAILTIRIDPPRQETQEEQ